jgi:diguanylate cyclase (GGDEF)-like protein/PAS domain S-box-containing protein
MSELKHQPRLLKKAVHRLLKVNRWWFAAIFLSFAIIVSVLIVVSIDLLWDGKLNPELEFAGVVTPLLDGLLCIILILAMLNELRAEVMRRETTERILNEAQRIAKIGNWTLDLTENRLEWSEEISRIFEIDSQQFGASYEAFNEAIHPEDRAKVNEAYRTSLETRLAYNISHRLLMKDGRIKYVIQRAETIYNAQKKPLRSIGTVQDVTDLKRLEQELQLRESVFRGLFENMSSAVAIYDAVDNGSDFIFHDFNLAGELIDNIKREQIIGKRLSEVFPKVKEYGLHTALQRVWRTGKAEHFPISFYSDERISRWRENFIFRLQSGELVVIYNDVTERKIAEVAIKESRENLQLLLDSMAEGAYGVDNNGNSTFINKAFLHLLGYQDSSEIVGHNIHNLIHHKHANGELYPECECNMHKAYENRQSINVSHEVFWRKDGTSIPIEYFSQPIIKDGAVIGAIATFIDITERKKAEEEIHKLAFYDALTGLANRRLLSDRIKQALIMSKRNNHYGALIFLDLDKFKSLNDAHGDNAGDMLLVEVATRIKSCVRAADSAARLGGDEFVVMLGELDTDKATSVKEAGIVAQKISQALAEPYSLIVQQESNAKVTVMHYCTASIGVMVFNSQSSPDDILRYADIAMYQAKEDGGNLVRFYDANELEVI